MNQMNPVPTPEEIKAAFTERKNALRVKLQAAVVMGDVTNPVTAEYSGYGDSGQIEFCSVEDSDLRTEVQSFFDDILCVEHPGYGDGDGGQGTFSWDLSTNVIQLDHSWNEMISNDVGIQEF